MINSVNNAILEFERRYCVTVMDAYDADCNWYTIQMDRGKCHAKARVSELPTEPLDMNCLLHDIYTLLVQQELDEIRKEIRHGYNQ